MQDSGKHTSAVADRGVGSSRSAGNKSTWRILVPVLASVVSAAGVPVDLLSQHLSPGYAEVVLFVGLALVPLLAVPTWADSSSPVLGWVQVAYPLFFSFGFLWAEPAYPVTWLWPLLVFAGNLSFVAIWWLATIDDDGTLRNPLARMIVALGTAVWVGVGLVLILCWVPRTGWTAHDAYAFFPSPAAMRYLDEDWNAVTWIYTVLLVATAALTCWLAVASVAADRPIRWLIAVTTTVDAAWTIWVQVNGASAETGWSGVLTTAEQFSAIVAIPYLAVLLTRRGAQRPRPLRTKRLSARQPCERCCGSCGAVVVIHRESASPKRPDVPISR